MTLGIFPDMVGDVNEYSLPDDELKPCPFCGREAYLRYIHIHGIWYQPHCSVCGCDWRGIFPTKEEAIKVWNKRK